jgi:SEC-C motif-containing protein
MTCRCESGTEFEKCCKPWLDGAPAPGPEPLMRSRYVAYCLGDLDYILNTTDPQRRLEVDADAVRTWMSDSVFTGLEVRTASVDGNKGVVEFVARFTTGDGPEQRHHEISRFRKQSGVWYFRQGKMVADA